jgi:hypothetical protein
MLGENTTIVKVNSTTYINIRQTLNDFQYKLN